MLSASARQARVHWGKCLGPRVRPSRGLSLGPGGAGVGQYPCFTVWGLAAWAGVLCCRALAEPGRAGPSALLPHVAARSLQCALASSGARHCPRGPRRNWWAPLVSQGLTGGRASEAPTRSHMSAVTRLSPPGGRVTVPRVSSRGLRPKPSRRAERREIT